jgi:hypothetical protein
VTNYEDARALRVATESIDIVAQIFRSRDGTIFDLVDSLGKIDSIRVSRLWPSGGHFRFDGALDEAENFVDLRRHMSG